MGTMKISKHPIYKSRQDIRKQINTLYAGTRAMREAREDYLPRFEMESPAQYERRINSTFLNNFIRQTAESFVGRVFKKNPVVELPDFMQPWTENIDMEGTILEVFLQKAFNIAIIEGHCFIHVDHTKAPTEEELGRKVTLKDEEGHRPYLRIVTASQLIDWEFTGNMLTYAVFQEAVTERGDEGLQEVTQWWVLTPGAWAIIREHDGEMTEYKSGVTAGMPIIPLVPVYTTSTGQFDSDPMLEDLSYKNIEHWQSSSDQRNILRVARVPILAEIGAIADDADTQREVSAHGFWSVPMGGDLKFVEHSGAAISAGVEDLERIERAAASYGLSILQQVDKYRRTATEVESENEASISKLGAAAKMASDGFANALWLMGWWKQKTLKLANIILQLNDKVGITIADPTKVQAVTEAYKLGALTVDTYLRQLQNVGAISDELDIEAEVLKLSEPSAVYDDTEQEDAV